MENQNIIYKCQRCNSNILVCTCSNTSLKYDWGNDIWTTNKVIGFVNWYIDMKDLGENNKLENLTIVESFLDGDSVDVWKGIKSIPEIFSFLRKNFTYDNENEVFQSKKRRLGAGTGDDSSLFVASSCGGTSIWWRSNRGDEDIIFDGKELKTEEEFNTVFELLDIKSFLKW